MELLLEQLGSISPLSLHSSSPSPTDELMICTGFTWIGFSSNKEEGQEKRDSLNQDWWQ